MKNKIRVLVVDDSVLIRKYLSDIINEDPMLELVDVAINGNDAVKKIKELKPDVVTLDLYMPDRDGLDVLKEIMDTCPTRVIMISSVTTKDNFATLLSLELGAVDFVPKPSGPADNIKKLKQKIITKIKNASIVENSVIKDIQDKRKKRKDEKEARKNNKLTIDEAIKEIKTANDLRKTRLVSEKAVNKGKASRSFVAIGCSTGGPNALKDIFSNPDINTDTAYLIVQHMPKPFTDMFANRLNTLGNINIKEAEDGDIINSGMGYLAPGDAHIKVINKGGIPIIRLERGYKVSGHIPSVDVLFESLANTYPISTIGVIMTGMGRDGADGIKYLYEKGGRTISQDKETSIVFGMNFEAIKTGCVEIVVPLNKIVDNINGLLKKTKH